MEIDDSLRDKESYLLFRPNSESTLKELIGRLCNCYCSRNNFVEISPANHQVHCPYRRMMKDTTLNQTSRFARDTVASE